MTAPTVSAFECSFCKPYPDGCDFGCRCVECAEPVSTFGAWPRPGEYPPPEPWYSPTCGCDECIEVEHEEDRIEAAISEGYEECV